MIRLYTFLIISAIGVIMGCMLWVLPRHDYVLHTQIVVVPQNPSLAMHMEHVMNNMVLIGEKAVAQDILVHKHGAHVVVAHKKHYSVLDVSVFAHTAQDVSVVQKSVLKNILQEINAIYALSDDVKVTVLAQKSMPEKTMSAVYGLYFVLGAVAIGVIAGVFMIFHIFGRMRDAGEYEEAIDGRRIFEKYHTAQYDDAYVIENIEQKEDVQNDCHENFVAREEEHHVNDEGVLADEEEIKEKQIKAEENKKTDEKSGSLSQKSAVPSGLPTTPGNLPVVDVDALGFARDTKKDAGHNSESDAKEPTEEELKARLNELLNGKL